MRRGWVLMWVLFWLVPMSNGQAQVRIGYGSEAGSVAFINQANHPGWEEPLPLGPLSFRATPSEVWVADSCGGRVYQFGVDGRKIKEIRVTDQPEQALWEDLALMKDADGKVTGLYLFNGSTQEIWKCDASGKLLQKFGGRGENKGQFLQGTLLEVGPTGTLFVADKARRIISVLAPDGSCKREVEWQWSGFFIDAKENLYRLHWNEQEKKTHLLVQDGDGKQTLDLALELPADHFNPELWLVTSQGNLFITFIDSQGFDGRVKTAEINRQGKLVHAGELTPPLVMNRLLCSSNIPGKFWLAKADFNKAPEGQFQVDLVSLQDAAGK